MNRILLITATFPPRSGSTVQRAFYNADILAELGHTVFVLTQCAENHWLMDADLSFSHLDQANVTYLPQFTWPFRSSSAFRKAVRLVSYPDEHLSWSLRGFGVAKRLVKEQKIDTLLVNLGAPSALLLAHRLKRAHPELTLIVDLQDTWANNPVAFGTRSKFRLLNTWLERKLFRNVDGLSVISETQKTTYLKRYPSLAPTTEVIHHGFDERKFGKAIPEVNTRSRLVLRYTGYVHPDMHVECFFEALRIFVIKENMTPSDICIEFYGGNPEFVRKLADKCMVSGFVKTHHHVSHSRVLGLMKGADVLLLFWTSDPACVCGKLFEYLGSGTYVLAFDQGNPDGRAIIEASNRGSWVSTRDVEVVVDTLVDLVGKREGRNGVIPVNGNDVSQFSRSSQVGRLSDLIQKCARGDTDA